MRSAFTRTLDKSAKTRLDLTFAAGIEHMQLLARGAGCRQHLACLSSRPQNLDELG